VRSRASLQLQLPQAPLYRTVRVVPDRPTASLRLRLPSVWRVGVRVCLPWRLEAEGSASFVPWHVHQDIALTRIDAVLTHVVGVGSYRISEVTMPRRFQDTWALHGVVRRHLDVGAHHVVVRVGFMLEPSAVPNVMLTAMTVDLPKAMGTLSATWRRNRLQLTASYGAIAMLGREVRQSAVFQLNPVAVGTGLAVPVGNGRYRGSAHLFGLGATAFF
jgi:long-subunit fatty acid transport protein